MYIYNPAPVSVRTWEQADAWINAGRNPHSHRKLKSKVRELRRADFGDIKFWLYDTDIITYHQDGTFTVYHGGYTTRTTISDMRLHSPANLLGVPGTSEVRHDMWGNERRAKWCSQWVLAHESDPLTPPKIQKCRRCHGTGHREPRICWAHNNWEMNDTTGSYEIVSTDPCRHGRVDDHEVTECYQCDGAGVYDYGSKPIPTAFGDRDRLHIDATGRVIRGIEEWASTIASIMKTRQRLGA